MSKEEEIKFALSQLKEKLGLEPDENLVDAIVKHLGIAAQGGDAALVACEQESERETIKQSFLIGKLGLKDSPALDEAIEKVCQDMGASNPQKRRIAFYYLLAKHFGKSLL